MKIYIDFDDVLCETAEYFTKIAKKCSVLTFLTGRFSF